MKNFLFTIISLFIFISCGCSHSIKDNDYRVTEPHVTIDKSKYKLIFLDDFDKDYSKMQNPTWNGNPNPVNSSYWYVWENSNNEYNLSFGDTHNSFLTAKNFKVSDGNLHIIASYDENCNAYLQPKMSTANLQWTQEANDWTGNTSTRKIRLGGYTAAEIRFKAPPKDKVRGSFAFYYEPDGTHRIRNNQYNFSEVDMFEILGYSNNINSTILNSETTALSTVPQGQEWRVRTGPKVDYQYDDSFFDNWHVFQFFWTSSGYKAFLDGKEIYTSTQMNNQTYSPKNYWCDSYTLVIGYDYDFWENRAPHITGIPQKAEDRAYFEPFEYLVDYVKIYQEK